MNLKDLTTSRSTVEVDKMGPKLTQEVRQHLIDLGLLVSQSSLVDLPLKLAFKKFKELNNQSDPDIIGAGSAKLLIEQAQEAKEAVILARDLIKRLEKCELKAYPDPGTRGKPYTIGYGSTRTLEGKEWKLGDTITLKMAEQLLEQDLRKRTLPGCRLIPVFITLDRYKQACLISFTYNAGPNFYGHTKYPTITKVLKENRLDDVPAALRLYINKGTPAEEGLRNRREEEVKYWLKYSKTALNPLGSKNMNKALIDRVLECCQKRGYKLDKRDGAANIVCIEGLNLDGTPNNDAPNRWNDLIGIITFKGDTAKFQCLYTGTTEPGTLYTVRPLNAGGAARLQLGQHPDIWVVGQHRGYQAMQQVGTATIVRDANRNYYRDDKVSKETGNGINLHTTKTTGWKGSVGSTVDGWSAGCVVIKDPNQFLNFMKIITASTQYKQNKNARFTLTLLWKEWL